MDLDRFEVDLDEKIGTIGIGYFSNVYKGTWRKRVVALKVLAASTPRKLFQHEIAIWESLSHPNVLDLYGASSAFGEPPWFFVSPYCKNGSLVTWLKGMRNGEEVDLLRCMHQVAKGMEYLHRKGVLHGDLKVRISFFSFCEGC
jgi:abelson tyrosine-protein kinase 1